MSSLITHDSYNIVGNFMHTGCLSDIAYHKNVYEIKRVEIDKFNEKMISIFIMICILDT